MRHLQPSTTPPQAPTILQQALAILRRFGTNAHAYIPGIGTISGLTAGNYLLADGSTGLTPVDGLQGLVLDGMGSVGTNKAPDPGCDTPASWNLSGAAYWSISGGKLNLSAAAATVAYADTGTYTDFTSGATYLVEFDLVGASGSLTVYVRGGSGQTLAISTRRVSFYYVAGVSGSTPLRFGSFGTGTFTIDNIVVSEISGIRATSSGAARPRLERGLRNLLTYSQDFTNAAWVASFSASKSDASSITFATGIDSKVEQLLAISGGTASKSFTVAALISCASGTAAFRLKNTHGGVTNNFSAELLATTTPQVFAFTVTNGVSAGNGTQIVGLINSAVTPLASTLISGGCAVFQGTLTAAQILAEGGIPLTTSAAASNPLAGRYSSQYSGAQSLTLGSVPTPNSGDFSVIVGVNATNATGNPRIYAARGATASIRLYMDNATGAIYSAWTDDAANTQQSGAPASDVGVTRIASIRRTGNAKELRVNGASRLVNSTAQGAYTLTAAEIGMQNAGTYLTGSLGPLVHVTGTITDADLLVLERFVASLTPNGPSF